MSTITEDVTCTFCGCLCDDISVEVEDNRIISVRRACANGRGTFLDYDPAPQRPTVGGREVDWEEAVAAAAHILNKADSPLIYGLSSTAIEAQRKAVELADRLGAVIDTTASVCHGPGGLAMQGTGMAGCTLGEVRNRADLLIFWGCNPVVSHPRHFSRYSLMSKGVLTPNGRRDRTVFMVDVRPTASTKAADHFLQVEPDSDFEVSKVLRAIVQGQDIEIETVGGLPVARLRELAERMKTCRYGVVFYGMGLTMSRARDYNLRELFTLVSELNQYTRFSVIPMRGHGNVAGADQVLTWQSGYPFAVSFARGYPQFGPGEFTAVDVLARREVDAALILASDPVAHLPGAASRQLKQIPTIILDPMKNLTARTADVVFPTACYGVDAVGTCYRLDKVPIRLRQVLPTVRPTDEEVLRQILKEIAQC
ncbi:MAG: formylmethanofuran dehydrogenase subunit B [Smithellaceae bacterium]|nr:formylmethanofuran dehydrogenase subunit B [Smithellaceae bacterium]